MPPWARPRPTSQYWWSCRRSPTVGSSAGPVALHLSYRKTQGEGGLHIDCECTRHGVERGVDSLVLWSCSSLTSCIFPPPAPLFLMAPCLSCPSFEAPYPLSSSPTTVASSLARHTLQASRLYSTVVGFTSKHPGYDLVNVSEDICIKSVQTHKRRQLIEGILKPRVVCIRCVCTGIFICTGSR